MAFVQRFDSTVIDITNEGCTIQDIYTAEWDDITVGSGVDVPVLGDTHTMTPHGYTCWVTHIRVDPLDNTHCRVTYIYSSNGFDSPRKQEGAGAWEEYVDTQSKEYTSDVVRTASVSSGESWEDLWVAANTEDDPHTIKNIPLLTLHKRDTIFRLVCYSSLSLYATLCQHINKINSTPFFNVYAAFKSAATGQNITWPQTDDSEQWLFSACSVDPVAENLYRYNLSFIWNQNETWNEPHGIGIGHYRTFTPSDLFSTISAVSSQVDGYTTGRGT